MTSILTCLKLVAYIASILIALEYTHRYYWSLRRRVLSSSLSPILRTLLSIALTSMPLAVTVAVTAFFCITLDGTSLSAIGLKTTKTSLLDFMRGIGVALISVSLMFMIGWYLGWFQIHPSAMFKSKNSFSIFCAGMADFFSGSAFEELAVRGYIFFVLMNVFGGESAVLISAFLFALLHWIKHPKTPPIFAINGILFGILIGQCRLVTGALWVPIGLHFGWNMAMGSFYGMPCAGRSYEDGLVTCNVEGPSWVTGGAYSPDAGIMGTITMLVTAAATVGLIPLG